MLVDDDELVADNICNCLSAESQYDVVWVKTAAEAIERSKECFDAILLDVVLPDADGIELCGQLRENRSCPIIFVSRLDDSETIVRALDCGADDFLAKPFDDAVLAARIRANIRQDSRKSPSKSTVKYTCSGFEFLDDRRIIKSDGQEAVLSPIEAQILIYLMQNPNTYITGEELYKQVWGRESFGDIRTVVVHIHNLRQKVDHAENPVFIKNIWGKGYLFDPDGKEGEYPGRHFGPRQAKYQAALEEEAKKASGSKGKTTGASWAKALKRFTEANSKR